MPLRRLFITLLFFSWSLRYHSFLICKATWKWNELKDADER